MVLFGAGQCCGPQWGGRGARAEEDQDRGGDVQGGARVWACPGLSTIRAGVTVEQAERGHGHTYFPSAAIEGMGLWQDLA